MSSSRTLSRKFRTFFTCIKPRFDPSIILLYIAASVEQYCDITQVNALPENEGILEELWLDRLMEFPKHQWLLCLTLTYILLGKLKIIGLDTDECFRIRVMSQEIRYPS